MTQHYSTIYRKGILYLSLLLASFMLGAGAYAQTYTNGVLSTGATALNGTAAPAGKTWSETQNVTGNTTVANSTGGVSANVTGGFSVADDFTITGASWNLTKITVYAYSTGYSGATSPFNNVRIQIRSGSVTGPVVFGDLTTNRLSSSANTNVLRTFNTLVPPSAPGTTRTIWTLEANVAVTLPAGTYWMEFQTGTIAGVTSNFVPLSSPVGVRTLPGYNAMQSDGTGYVTLTDAGVDQSGNDAGLPVNVDVPFKLDYSTGPCAGTPAPGNTISSLASVCPASPFSLSLQNATSGGGVTYQWQSSSTGTPGSFTNITGATSSTLTVAAITASTYYQAIVTCSGASTTSNPVQVNLNPPSACYCVPNTVNCSLDDQIQQVIFGGINNTSTCSPGGYGNFTSLPAGTAIAGGANAISVKVGPGGTEYVAVWIDYNKNGTFEPSEYTALGSGNNVFINGNIIVPANALLGNTRMRVRVRYNTNPSPTEACTTTGSFGEVEDYTVNIIACVPVTVTTQTVSKSVVCGANTFFSVVTAGSLPTYQWQYRTSPTAIWMNVPATAPYTGVNKDTLFLTGPTATLSGYEYRVLVSGACAGANPSTAATLTVTAIAPVVTPASASICAGSIQKLSLANLTSPAPGSVTINSGTLNTAILQSNTVGIIVPLVVTGVPVGATIKSVSVKMNVTHPQAGFSLVSVLQSPVAGNPVINLDYATTLTQSTGANFRNTVISSAGTATLGSGSAPWTGTFKADAQLVAAAPFAPTGPDGYLATTTNFSDLWAGNTGNGTWKFGIYDFGTDPGANGSLDNVSITINYEVGAPALGVWTGGQAGSIFTDAGATVPYSGTPVNAVYVKPSATSTYSVSFNSPNGCVSSVKDVKVSVVKAPTAVTAVANKATCNGGNAMFISSATGAEGVVRQWQVSTDGGATYTNVANGGVYSGATTDSLTITGATNSLNNNRYRLSVTAAPCVGGPFTSTAGILKINANPVIVISASPSPELLPNTTTTLTAAVSPNPGATYMWYKNGVLVAGATGNTLVVGVDDLGTYTVRVNDVNTCGGTSNSIVVSSKQSDVLFIYPNPNTGSFQVRYYSAPGNNPLPRVLNIFDSKGSRIYSQTYTIGSPYMQMNVNLSAYSKGIYSVEVSDRNGNRLKTGRVLIQ